MQQSPDYKQKLFQVNWLACIDGVDVRDCTWHILKRVIGKEPQLEGSQWKDITVRSPTRRSHDWEVYLFTYRISCLSQMIRKA
ncbi:hypothetical protein AMELA_G00259230 [Ameiurus melas]|uniref:Uncharacterized protein n=1 Tax=Ameiurus melas TaxID=219545 RepID=A0A7J5ZQW5_AMEME|nr:hypothetical protein AMELA_G00259230 [Ameiurus melas]